MAAEALKVLLMCVLAPFAAFFVLVLIYSLCWMAALCDDETEKRTGVSYRG